MPASSPALNTLATWLAGEFENRHQALEQPVWFVHLRLWQRPLRYRIEGHFALFAEQANALYPDQPYRQRVLVLSESGNQLQVQYLALKQPDRFRGAGANADLLSQLTPSDLEELPGCVLAIAQKDDVFIAEPTPTTRCCFRYQGQMRQVILGFEAHPDRLLTHDRGIDPETGQALWGALMGPYDFTKSQTFAAELPPA